MRSRNKLEYICVKMRPYTKESGQPFRSTASDRTERRKRRRGIPKGPK